MKYFLIPLLLSLVPVLSFAQTSENNDKLRDGLKRFPQADTNKDGILTMDEARAFLAKMKPAGRNGADSPNAIKPDMINIAYGPHERNVLDFWKAKADKPTALVVFIHGGGFRAGSKENYWPDAKLAEMLKSGVSCASVNYRYLDT
ncbi:MAG: alpha/beta hydrolase, partial [Verrucomicrobiaceae bacterium]|nr:alpha/beta hydrolase [Verrucomicrobiaceae bacterium]